MTEPLLLRNEHLVVEVAAPGTDYTSSRFDWTTQVRQITLDGRTTFLTRENLALAQPEGQGWGLSGEWGIERSIGYDECPVGEWFPKIGVGLLQRRDEKPYHFFRRYPVLPALVTVERPSEHELVMVQTQEEHRGYSWRLERRWSVSGRHLHLITRLSNTGIKTLATDEYLHNFVRFGETSVNADWTLTLETPMDRARWAKDVDPDRLWKEDGTTLRWTKAASEEFFFSRATQPAPTWWELTHSSGALVRETAHFSPSHCNVWGKGHVVSPELFWTFVASPGQTVESARTWTFGHAGSAQE